jgi:hypothetical protein
MRFGSRPIEKLKPRNFRVEGFEHSLVSHPLLARSVIAGGSSGAAPGCALTGLPGAVTGFANAVTQPANAMAALENAAIQLAGAVTELAGPVIQFA